MAKLKTTDIFWNGEISFVFSRELIPFFFIDSNFSLPPQSDYSLGVYTNSLMI